MSTFFLSVVTPDGIFFEGQVRRVVVRTRTGDVGIMAGHISYVAALGIGKLRITLDGGVRVAAVADGVLKVSKEKTVILAQTCEWADEIDVERARRAEEMARQRLQTLQSGKEFERAELKLRRALNRLSIAEKE